MFDHQYVVFGGGVGPKNCRSKGNAILVGKERRDKLRRGLVEHGPVVILDTLDNEIVTP